MRLKKLNGRVEHRLESDIDILVEFSPDVYVGFLKCLIMTNKK